MPRSCRKSWKILTQTPRRCCGKATTIKGHRGAGIRIPRAVS
ncbi:uncharacterized protein (DUF433 family) [Rhizobium paranaense]|uniref:Uncharacterized protein (DUF433 family) n=1 Tax=Rhizobium paranaense TaxID=1650438 RepID=A0A7W8XS97_9HYPH|nr:uncharacterized protein (DUF433 family) [Rhizobium paranaense]